jgi:hypothetical protein
MQVATWFALVQGRVGAKGLCHAGAPWSGETSRPDRGTRWPAGSSAGRMVARKARQSCGQEPMQGNGSRPESARGVCGGSPQNRRVTWLNHKTKTESSTSGDGIQAR